MAKFSNGVPCPLKGEEKHYDSYEEAKAAYEAAMAKDATEE